MANPVRFPSGVTSARTGVFADVGIGLDPTKWIIFSDDFVRFNSADWTISTTEAGAGDATEALGTIANSGIANTAADAGGVLVITNDDADNDADFFYKTGELFLITPGKKTAFAARWKVSDATQADIVIGLQVADTTPLVIADAMYFKSSDGAATMDFRCLESSNATDYASVATLADNTWIETSFIYNGTDAIDLYVDGVKIGSVGVTTLPDDVLLTVGFGVQNGEAVAKTMTIDYIHVAQER